MKKQIVYLFTKRNKIKRKNFLVFVLTSNQQDHVMLMEDMLRIMLKKMANGYNKMKKKLNNKLNE